jgi:HK97 family phage portal protein
MSFARGLFGLPSRERTVQRATPYVDPPPPAITENEWSSILDLRDYGFPDNETGERVTADRAVTIAAVYSACKIIAETIASFPLELHRRLPNGDTEEATDLDLYWIAKQRPNDEDTKMGVQETMIFTAALRGEGLCYQKRTTRGALQEYYYIHPDRVRKKRHRDELIYEVSRYWSPERGPYGGYDICYAEDFWRIENTSINGADAASPIQMFASALGGLLAQRRYTNSLLRNSAIPRGFMTSDPTAEIDPDTLDKYEAVWVDYMRGPGNAGKTPFLPYGIKYQNLMLSPVDLALIDLFHISVADVSRIWRVPLHMLSELSRSTNNNISTQDKEFIRDCVRPWAVRTEQTADRDLLTESQRRAGLFFKLNIDSLLAGDSLTQMQTLTGYHRSAILNTDEVRSVLNRNAIPGGVGKKHLAQAQMVDIEHNPLEAEATGDKPEEKEDTERAQKLEAQLHAVLVGSIGDATEKVVRKQKNRLADDAQRSKNINDFRRCLDSFVGAHLAFTEDVLLPPCKRAVDALGVNVDAAAIVRTFTNQLIDSIRSKYSQCETIDQVAEVARSMNDDPQKFAQDLFTQIRQAKEKGNEDSAAA